MATRRISEQVWQVGGTILSHPCDCAVYLIRGENNVLIDCGNPDGLPRIVENLREIDLGPDEISAVIGTHNHYDHVGGFKALKEFNPGMMLVLHEADREAVQTGDPELTCAGWMFGAQFPAVGVNRSIKGREEVQFGDTVLTCIPAPGHTPGSMLVLFKESGELTHLFLGDALSPSSAKVQASFEDWLDTIELLAGIDTDRVHFGHNYRIGSMRLLGRNQAAIEYEAFKQALKLRYAPKGILDLYWKTNMAVYDNLLPFMDPPILAAARGVNFLLNAMKSKKE